MDFEVQQFKYLTTADPGDLYWRNWSRCYEYPFVLDALGRERLSVHNVACGGQLALHRWFSEELNYRHDVFNSDLVDYGGFRNWFRYDVGDKLDTKFGSVVCVSTLEHVAGAPISVLMENLMAQVRPGGKLILTFDVPSVSVSEVEEFIGARCVDVWERLNGMNSVFPESHCKDINVVALSMKRRQ